MILTAIENINYDNQPYDSGQGSIDGYGSSSGLGDGYSNINGTGYGNGDGTGDGNGNGVANCYAYYDINYINL